MRLTWILAVVLAVGAVAQTPEAMLGAALHQERVTGNLQAAIDGYRKVLAVKGVSRTVAAQAQYHIGICYEKLGDQEARRAFENVVKNYGDQRDFVSQARARLAAMGGGNTGEPRTRLVWDGATDFWGRVSADGRYLSFVDWETGDLAVRDLKAGSSRRVTNYGGYDKAKGEAESTSISPDGKRIVFNWNSWDKASKVEGIYQLRVINADGTGERVLRKAEPSLFFEAFGWSHDGKWVATCEQTGDPNESAHKAQIVLVSLDTSERKIVPTTSNEFKRDISFSPDGKWLAYVEPPKRHAATKNLYVVGLSGEGQSSTMVAENVTFMGWTPKGDGLLARRNEKAGDPLYMLPFAGGKVSGEAKALHLPSADMAQPLGITPGGDLFYGTMNRRIEAAVGTIDATNGLSMAAAKKQEVFGIGFANNHGNLRFSPDGRWFATTNSSQSIRIRNLAGDSERILNLPVRELRRFDWMPDGRSLITSALGTDNKFGLYRVDSNNGAVSFLCPIQGGVVFTPAADGKSVFHFTTSGLHLIDLATGDQRTVLARNFGSQGPQNIRLSRDGKSLLLTSFAYIGIYDTTSGELRDIYRRPEEAGTNIWVADWSHDGQHIYAYAVARSEANGDRARELLIYPAKGGEPKRQHLAGVYRDFSTSPDGIHAAITKTESHSQVWVIENFLPGTTK